MMWFIKNIIIEFLKGVKFTGIILVLFFFFIIGLGFMSKIFNEHAIVEFVLLCLFCSGFIKMLMYILN